jgi:hypothetical protein
MESQTENNTAPGKTILTTVLEAADKALRDCVEMTGGEWTVPERWLQCEIARAFGDVSARICWHRPAPAG